MKFFIDTANLDQIREAQALGVLDGVTTNPSLMAKEGITGANNILKHYVAICEIVDGDVSAEVIAVDFEGMVREGEALAALHPQIVVKIPMTRRGSQSPKILFRCRHQNQLYSCIFSRTSTTRCQSRSNLCFSFYRTTG